MPVHGTPLPAFVLPAPLLPLTAQMWACTPCAFPCDLAFWLQLLHMSATPSSRINERPPSEDSCYRLTEAPARGSRAMYRQAVAAGGGAAGAGALDAHAGPLLQLRPGNGPVDWPRALMLPARASSSPSASGASGMPPHHTQDQDGHAAERLARAACLGSGAGSPVGRLQHLLRPLLWRRLACCLHCNGDSCSLLEGPQRAQRGRAIRMALVRVLLNASRLQR